MSISVRKRGIRRFLLGFAAGVAAGFFLYWLQQQGYMLNSFAMIAVATPAAWGLVGLLEIITNRPFSEMEDWWNGLRGWQRGILGLFVVIFAFALLIGGIAAAGFLGLI
jgi:hypothetical protein